MHTMTETISNERHDCTVSGGQFLILCVDSIYRAAIASVHTPSDTLEQQKYEE